MPTVKPGESQQDYVSRCIPIVMDEGKTREQAAGKCYGMYQSQKAKKEAPKLGRPKTDIERLKAHFGDDWREHSVDELPPRGSKIKENSEMKKNALLKRIEKARKVLKTGIKETLGLKKVEKQKKSEIFNNDFEEYGKLNQDKKKKTSEKVSKQKSRPPKAWWDNCVSTAKKFSDDPDKFCGWMWHHGKEEGFDPQRTAIGKKELTEKAMKNLNMIYKRNQKK